MNGGTSVLQTDKLISPVEEAEKTSNAGQVFENSGTEKMSDSEDAAKLRKTRFARFKKAIRKRSASIL